MFLYSFVLFFKYYVMNVSDWFDDRGVSPVIGVILMVAIVVLLVGIAGTYAFTSADDSLNTTSQERDRLFDQLNEKSGTTDESGVMVDRMQKIVLIQLVVLMEMVRLVGLLGLLVGMLVSHILKLMLKVKKKLVGLLEHILMVIFCFIVFKWCS